MSRLKLLVAVVLCVAISITASAAEPYRVYQKDNLIGEFGTYEQSIAYARSYSKCLVKLNGVVWTYSEGGSQPVRDTGNFEVYQNSDYLQSFTSYNEAVDYARRWSDSRITGELSVWSGYKEYGAVDLNSAIGIPENYTASSGFTVYQNDTQLKSFSNKDAAIEFAKKFACSYVISSSNVVWHNFPRLSRLDSMDFAEFDDAASAVAHARANGLAVISAANEPFVVWESTPPKGAAKINNAPMIMQNPELPRGCEVTSLCMLLNYYGVDVDKMELAERIRKSPLRYDDPNNGFIGNMYNMRMHGLGVYHDPIAELAQQYIPSGIVDMTGCEFNDLFYYLDNDQPVWIVTNSRFSVLPQSEFVTWNTPSGPINITYREHSVLVTGYDENYIYFNDPLVGANRRSQRKSFIAGWEQMGRQAVCLSPSVKNSFSYFSHTASMTP